jgi:hypothetical protein
MTVSQCADLLWLCFGLAAWRTLVHDCHWTWDQAEATLTAMATRLLVA